MRGPSSRARSGRVDPPGRWTTSTGSSPGTGTVCPGIVGPDRGTGSWGCERPDRARAPPCPGPHPRTAGPAIRADPVQRVAPPRAPQRGCRSANAEQAPRPGAFIGPAAGCPSKDEPMSALIETATAGHPAAPLAPRPADAAADAASLGPGAVGGRSGVHAPASGGRPVFTLPLPPQRFGPARVAAGVQEDAACSD